MRRAHPYRSSARTDGAGRAFCEPIEPSVIPVLALFWIASGARVMLGIVRHEFFATEATLALLAFLVVPFAVRKSVRARRTKH